MAHGESEPIRPEPPDAASGQAVADLDAPDPSVSGQVIETVVNPFHCLYQDALWLHTQSHLRHPRSESEAARLARASLLLYLQAAEALVHQAALELGRPELAHLLTDPAHPRPLAEAWTLLPAIAAEDSSPAFDPDRPPWPQFLELLELRDAWTYPGPPSSRRAYYIAAPGGSRFEPIDPRRLPRDGSFDAADRLRQSRTGLPRDPYALRPQHLDTARGVLDQAVAALDHCLGGALTRDARHRKEPCRVLPTRDRFGG